MKLHILTVFLGIIMITSTFSMGTGHAFLPDLPEQSKAPSAFESHVRVIEGPNITAYARALYTSIDNPSYHEVPKSDPHDGVAKLILTRDDGTFGCSGTLAQDKIHVFTAAHCVTDDAGGYILQSGSATFEGNNESISIAIDAGNSVSHPDYDGDYLKGNDIAILKLDSIPTGVPGIPHTKSGNEVGLDVYKTGYGISGYFSSGTEVPPYYFGTQRGGINTYDAFGDVMYDALGLTSGTDYIPGAVYQFDSDDGSSAHDAFGFFFGNSHTGLGNNEVMLASGDSGGPTFENGKLVGISSYGITLEYSFGPLPRTSDCTSQLDSSCGEFGGDTRVSFYSGWIDTIVGNSVVGPSNNPPTANDDSANVNEGDLVNIDLAANDSDSDDGLALGSISIVSAPSHGSVDVNVDGTVDYTHTGSDTTSDSFTYTIDDLSGASSNLATVDITVNAVVGSPPIKITSPGDGQTVSGKITISATVNVDGATVEFFVNGVSVGDSSGPSYQVTYHSKGMNTGANEIRAVILPLPVTDPTYEDIITVYKDGKSGSDDGGSSGSGPPPGKGKNK